MFGLFADDMSRQDQGAELERPSTSREEATWHLPPPIQRAAGSHPRLPAIQDRQTGEQDAPEEGRRDLRVVLARLEDEFLVIELPCHRAHPDSPARQPGARGDRPPGDRPWTECPDCGEWYATAYNMRRHRRSAHQGFRVRCPLCMTTCTRQDTLNQHMEQHHPQQ